MSPTSASPRLAWAVEQLGVQPADRVLHQADLGEERFDEALAVDFPPLLRGRPGRELEVIARHLTDGGRPHVVTQPLRSPAAAADSITARLEGHGFVIGSVLIEQVHTHEAVCVVARPPLGRGLQPRP